MCRAHVVRFSCAHGLLMGFEACKLGPCPVLKTCGDRLPQQPYRCYNCQLRKQGRTSRPSTARTSCAPSAVLDGDEMDAAALISVRRAHTFPISAPSVFHALPNVAKQPDNCVQLLAMQRRPTSAKPFRFSCQSSSHTMTPHYFGLSSHLPHQDHACPPCQLQEMRSKGQADVVKQARERYPKLTVEMLIRDGTIKEFQEKPTWEQFLDEAVTEEHELWHHVTRKWTQDLQKCRVLVAEEDGLGLLP